MTNKFKGKEDIRFINIGDGKITGNSLNKEDPLYPDGGLNLAVYDVFTNTMYLKNKLDMLGKYPFVVFSEEDSDIEYTTTNSNKLLQNSEFGTIKGDRSTLIGTQSCFITTRFTSVLSSYSCNLKSSFGSYLSVLSSCESGIEDNSVINNSFIFGSLKSTLYGSSSVGLGIISSYGCSLHGEFSSILASKNYTSFEEYGISGGFEQKKGWSLNSKSGNLFLKGNIHSENSNNYSVSLPKLDNSDLRMKIVTIDRGKVRLASYEGDDPVGVVVDMETSCSLGAFRSDHCYVSLLGVVDVLASKDLDMDCEFLGFSNGILVPKDSESLSWKLLSLVDNVNGDGYIAKVLIR